MLSQCASHEGKEKMCLEAKKSAPNCCCHNFTLWISKKKSAGFCPYNPVNNLVLCFKGEPGIVGPPGPPGHNGQKVKITTNCTKPWTHDGWVG